MDVQMPVRKPFATEYISAPEENGALGNIFTELYETLGFLERNYQSTPSCTEQIKNLLTGSPLVSLPKTMEFSFYDQNQHDISIEQQPSYFEPSLSNSKGSWMPMDSQDIQPVQFNSEVLYSRKLDRNSSDENKKNGNHQHIIVSNGKSHINELSILNRKRKMELIAQDNKVQIMCSNSDTPVRTNTPRILQEQCKVNTKLDNIQRIVWPAEDLSLTDDEDLVTPYSISDALLSLSSFPNLKHESSAVASKLVESVPDSHQVNSQNKTLKEKNDENICFQEFMHGHQSPHSDTCKPIDANLNASSHDDTCARQNSVTKNSNAKDCRFQYVLGAATSIATKINEESLTYLNQRQSYEIKLKKLGDLSAYKGKILKTIIRICFHERRLQFMEKEQIKLWKEAHPGERIIDIDVPLSYGFHRIVKQTPANTVELFWDPMKEAGIYVKVNCVSTEFTPKKHGGEKGVPFRIQVETYILNGEDNFQENASSELLHAAFCQIRVFKLKGADRKHKQDRDKIFKRSAIEQKRYKPSCECTILNNMSCELILANYPQTYSSDQRSPEHGNSPGRVPTEPAIVPLVKTVLSNENIEQVQSSCDLSSPVSVRSEHLYNEDIPLCQDTNTERMSQWLQNNRFSAYLSTFSHFSGTDIWSLSREDLIQICGVPDGIRLYNCLHTKMKSSPCLTFYVCSDAAAPCNAVYMQTLTVTEFVHKVHRFISTGKSADNNTMNDSDNSYSKLTFYILGPGGIHIILTNELISNIQEKSIFEISVEQNKVILKPITKNE